MGIAAVTAACFYQAADIHALLTKAAGLIRAGAAAPYLITACSRVQASTRGEWASVYALGHLRVGVAQVGGFVK